MSDTITPEERAELRKAAKDASALPWKVEGCYSSNTNVRAIRADGVGFAVTHLSAMRDNWAEDAAYIVSACNMAPRLLNALEQAEARADQLSVSLLGAISKQSEMAEGIEEITAANKGLAEKARQAEANVERLTKERDWLASEHIKLFELMYPHRTGLYTKQTMIDEAARRAVAESGVK